jgi:hypothetical protein
MPAQFGPIVGDSTSELVTHDKLDVTIQLEVDASAARTLLPTWTGRDGKTYGYRPLPMGPNGKPILFVNYTQERDVDYMAGGGYNEIEFYLSAEFVGERSWHFNGASFNAAQGMFAVLLMPSHLIPLLAGRDIFGTPKHLANIGDLVVAKMFPNDATMSGWFEGKDRNGDAFIAGSLRNVSAIPYEALSEVQASPEPLPPENGWGRATAIEPGAKVMAWKYVAAANWTEHQPDISYHLALELGGYPSKELSQPRAGDGNIVFPHVLSASDDPCLFPAFDAIKRLIQAHSLPFPGNTLIRHYSNAYRSRDVHIMDGQRLPISSESR